MKKLISWILALTMVFSLFPVQLVAAAGTPTIAIGTASVKVEEGEDSYVYLPINITNNPKVAGITWYVTIPAGWAIDAFDYLDEAGETGSIFTAVDRRGNLFLNANEEHNLTTGKFNLGTTDPVGIDGVVAWIVFSVPYEVVNGDYEISIESCEKICDDNTAVDKTAQFAFVPGKVTVTGGLDKDDLKPTITTQPASASYTYNADIAPLSVEATKPDICGNLTYQWYKNDAKIVGATNATYQPELIYGTTSYYCEVTTTYRDEPYSITSKVAEITYSKAALPKDRFLLEENSFIYDGTEKSPAVSTFGAAGQKPLEPNVDWRIVRTCQSSAVEAGTYTISVEGLGNYEGVIEWTWTIERADVTAPKAEENLVYNGKVQTGVPEGEGYTLTGNAEQTAGGYTAVAVLDNNHKWADGTTADKNISWSIEPKTVQTVWSNTELTYNGKEQAPAATADTGIAGETLTVNVDGGKKNVGENYTATASIGNKNYALDAAGATTSFSIAAKEVAVQWSNTELTYNGKEQAPTAAVETGIAGESLTPTVTGGKKDAGENYTAKANTENANYKLTNAQTAYSIAANTQFADATAKEQNVVIEVGNFTEPKFTGVDGEAVTGTVTYTYKGETKTAAQINTDLQTMAVDSGAEIAYSFEASGNYSGTKTGTIKIKMVSIVFEVGGAEATIDNAVAVKDDATYGDSWAEIVKINDIAASVNKVPVAGKYILDVSGKPDAGKNIPFKVLFTADNDARYQNVEVVSGTVDVAAKKVAVNWGNAQLTYAGKEQTPAASATGIDNYNIPLDVTGGQTNAGEGYTAAAATDDANYELTGATKTFAIAPKSVEVQWTNTALTYNGQEQAPAAAADTGIAGETLSVAVSGGATAAGNYTATASIDDSNYKLTGASKTYAIKALSLKTEDMEIDAIEQQIYAGTAIKPAVSITHKVTGEQLGAEDVTVTYTDNTNAGTAKVTIAGKGNYTGKLTDAASFSIAPKNVDVVWSNTALTYNGKKQAPAAAVETGIAGESLALTVTGGATNAGSYTATAAVNNSNYVLTNTQTEYTIAANTQFTDVTAKEQNVVIEVGSFTEPKFTGVDGEAVTGDVTYTYEGSAKTADEINAVLKTLAEDAEVEINYSFEASGNYSGTKAGTIKVKMVSIIFEVGDAEAAIDNAVTIKADAAYGDNWTDIVRINSIAASVNGTPVAGKYTLDVSGIPAAGVNFPFKVLFTADSDERYQNVEVVSGTVNVAAKKVAVEWSNTELTYTGAEQAPTATVKGIDGNNIPVVVTGHATNVGEGYTAVAAIDDANYELTGAEQTFAIVPAPISGTVTITAAGDAFFKGAEVSVAMDINADQVTYQWLKDGAEIQGATEVTYIIGEGMTGSFLSVKVTASGNYTGSITSGTVEVGKVKLTATVAITGETAVGSELTAAVTGEGTYDIVWLVDGAVIEGASELTYTVTKADQGKQITVKIIGNGDYSGEAVSEAVAVPAGRPDAVVLSARASSRKVTLSWQAPADNGAAITGYQVKVDDGEWIDVAAEENSYVFTSLKNSTEYTFYIKAINAAGESDEATVTAKPRGIPVSGGGAAPGTPSTPSTPDTPEKPDIPEQPDNVTTKTDAAGNTTSTTKKEDGSVEVKAELNAHAVDDAVKNDTAIELPMEPISVGDKATEVAVSTGAEEAVKVEIPVADATAGTVAAVIGENGEQKIIRDCVATEDGIVVAVNDGDKVVLLDNSKTFDDVADSHWGKNAVSFVVARGLFAGVGSNNFAPEVTTNRGMVVQVLHNLEYNAAHGVEHSFHDVGDHHWYDAAVSWAAEKKIVGGYPDGSFQGEKKVTREELVVMLWNYAGKQTTKDSSLVNGFNDAAKVSDWAKTAMNWALENGILGGKGGKMLDPTGFATRAELAQMMKNYLENI